MSEDLLHSAIIVTTADAEHFDLAWEMIESVRQHACLDPIKIGMLDVGLTDAQRSFLLAKNVVVARAEWKFDSDPPPGMPRRYLAMFARPFLPDFFTGFDPLVYLDSDTWIQIPSGVNDLIAAAAKVDVAAIPEMHPSYMHLYDPRHAVRLSHRSTFAGTYGQGIPNPADNVVLNSGVLAARRESRLWKAWVLSLAEALARVRDVVSPNGKPLFATSHPIPHFIEQNALNHACYQRGLSLHPMSALYNFICTLSEPLFDPEINKLVEPTPPNAPIKIIHLTGAGRKARIVGDRNGGVLQRGMRWRDWRETLACWRALDIPGVATPNHLTFNSDPAGSGRPS